MALSRAAPISSRDGGSAVRRSCSGDQVVANSDPDSQPAHPHDLFTPDRPMRTSACVSAYGSCRFENSRYKGDMHSADASASGPLLALDLSSATDRRVLRGTVTLTDTGRSVLAGRLDRVQTCGIDRPLGGVHLQSRSRTWRWDDARAAGHSIERHRPANCGNLIRAQPKSFK